MTPDLESTASSSAEMQAAFARQRAAFSAEPWPDWTLRRDRLRRLQTLLETHEAEIAAAIDADFGGRPAFETDLAEQFASLEAVKGA